MLADEAIIKTTLFPVEIVAIAVRVRNCRMVLV